MKGPDLIDFLVRAAQQGASDLHLTAGAPPMMRVAGVMQPLTEEPLSAEDTRRLVIDALKEGQRAKLENDWQIDFALQVDDLGRFRGNACYVSGAIEAKFRRAQLRFSAQKRVETGCGRHSCWRVAGHGHDPNCDYGGGNRTPRDWNHAHQRCANGHWARS